MPTAPPSEPLLLPGTARETCRAVVVIPAKNEEAVLPRCLHALARQKSLDGTALPSTSFEILVLLNNCTDRTAHAARQWHARHPKVQLHLAERNFPPDQAHAGTARKLLMDTAHARLANKQHRTTAILSTDADTVVAPDWIAQNLQALVQGADVVGGLIELLPGELAALPQHVRHCYEQDRRYASLVAQLEDMLDPRPGDRWPRHLDHFGSSLACTPNAYEMSGGMPAVGALEDEAFVDRVRRADLRLRHEPAVRVFTSARLHGRAELGLAKQFCCWSKLPNGEEHRVLSAEYLEYRFRFMHRLRRIYDTGDTGDLFLPTQWWKDTVANALACEPTCPAFLGAIFCDILIQESFARDRGLEPQETIGQTIASLLQKVRLGASDPVVSPDPEAEPSRMPTYLRHPIAFRFRHTDRPDTRDGERISANLPSRFS